MLGSVLTIIVGSSAPILRKIYQKFTQNTDDFVHIQIALIDQAINQMCSWVKHQGVNKV